MRKISFGEINKSLLLILLISLFSALEHYINGYTYIGCFYKLNIYKTIYSIFVDNNPNDNDFHRHRIFDPFFGYIGVIILAFFVGRQKDKDENMEKINLILSKDLTLHLNTKNEDNVVNNGKSGLKMFGFFIAILILWVAEENLLLIYVDIFQDLDFWFFELIFISLIFPKHFFFKIYSHQILGMAISITVGSILKIYNITMAFTSEDKEKTIYSKNPYVFFFMIFYFLLIIARSYVNTQLKVFMDLKFISKRALLMFHGIIGAIMCFITGMIVSFSPCPSYMNNYVCKINYEGKLYYDNISEYIGSGKDILVRVIIIILGMNTYFFLKYFSIEVIKNYTPIHVIFSFPIQYFIEKTFLWIFTLIFYFDKLFPEENQKEKFATDEAGDIGAIIGFLIYLEIIELNFCGLNYNIRKNIIYRGDKEYKIALNMNAKLMEEFTD